MLQPRLPEHALILHDDRLSIERRIAARIADALRRGDRVIHTHLAPASDIEPGLLGLLPGGVAGHEQLELVSVAEQRERTGLRAADVIAAYAARVDQARQEGYAGVTCSGDVGAWLELADDVVAFEEGMHELARVPGTAIVCGYALDAVRARNGGLAASLAGCHHGHVEDLRWSATMHGSVVRLEGQLDETNADRVRAVLLRALDGPAHTVDLRGVTYLSSEAVRSLEDAADRATETERQLRLVRIPAVVRRTFDVAGLGDRPGVAMPATETLTPITGTREESLRIANVFQSLAQLEEATSEAEAVSGLATMLCEVIAPAADLSVTIGPPTNPSVIDSSGPLAQRLDGLQMRADEGPCQSAWDTRERVLTPDLRADARWPALTALAADTEVASILTLPVHVRDEMIGVINAYSTSADAFGGVDLEIADLAAFAVGQVFQRIESTRALSDMVINLRQALSSRSVIDQAKGILMARHGYDADAAFAALSEQSQRENVKVRELAATLIEQVRGGGAG